MLGGLVSVTLLAAGCSGPPAARPGAMAAANIEPGAGLGDAAPMPSPRPPAGREPSPGRERPSGEPTLTTVRMRVLQAYNLTVAAEALRVDEARAMADQASLWPNPELVFRERRIRDLDPIGTPMIEVEIGQPLELGGKRQARTELALARTDQRSVEHDALVLSTLRQAELQFVTVLRLQRDLELARDEATTSTELVELAAARLRSGRARRGPVLRFQAAAADADLAARDLSLRLTAACRTLDELLGLPVGSITTVRGALADEGLVAVPAVGAIVHPRLEAARRAVAVAERALDSAAAEAWPDLTVGLGYAREQLTDEDFLGVFFKMPLPIWNRNQGQRLAAEAALRRVRTELAAEELKLGSALASARLLLDTARGSAESYAAGVLPKLDEAHRLVDAAWRAGRSSLLEVLDARLALVRGRRRQLDHLEQWAKAAVEVRYLAGRLP